MAKLCTNRYKNEVLVRCCICLLLGLSLTSDMFGMALEACSVTWPKDTKGDGGRSVKFITHTYLEVR